MRLFRLSLSLIAFLLVLVLVGATMCLHLAVTGKSLPLTKALVAGLGKVVEGQRVEQAALDLYVRPATRHLVGTARLHVRALASGRRYLYFVLNGGLRVRQAWREETDGRRVPLDFHQIALITVLDIGRGLDADELVQVGLQYDGDPLAGGTPTGRGVMDPEEVILVPGDFWYPADLQGSFMADVAVTLPAGLTVAHNGRETSLEHLGDATRVRWASHRPVPGLALVAGRFREMTRTIQERRYRVLLAPGANLDAERVMTSGAASDRLFTELYGTSGLPQATLFVSRNLPRAFNDGGGLIGIPSRCFHRGDYGAAVVAHEIAHNWWGGTVGERWLDPGTGGQWIVEGFAQFSSWLAVRDQLGEAAMVRLREADFFDPRRAPTLHALSVLDNYLDREARPVIYGKGAYVTSMLRQEVGEAQFAAAAKELIAAFRYAQVTDADAAAVFSRVAGRDLSEFFAVWVRSDAMLDLALEAQEGGAVVHNRGPALAPASMGLWRLPPDGNPALQTVTIGSTTPLGNAEYLILDPLLDSPDLYRDSNVLPRRPNPRAVERSARGEFMVVYGEPYPWAPATVTHLDADGHVLHTWEFQRGVAVDPVWSADGTRILAVERDYAGVKHLVVLKSTDGSRQRLRSEGPVTGTSDATLVARADRLVRLEEGRSSTVLRRPGFELGSPLASPDGKRLAYTARTRGEMELRVAGVNGNEDRLLLLWAPSDVDWAWAADGSRLFALLPGDWDWQLWEIPLGGEPPRILVREAAAMASLAVAPDGLRVAFVAAADLDYGKERREVFVIEPQSATVVRFNLESRYGHDVAWLDSGSLLVVTSDPVTAAVPRRRELRRLVLPDGRLEPFP